MRLRTWAVAAVWVIGVIAAFASYLQLARTRAVNSDGASNALQAWDMLHGNLLLHGWSLSDVSFYTTELPQYMLVEFLRGLNEDVVHAAAAMTYTLATLLAALLAKGTAVVELITGCDYRTGALGTPLMPIADSACPGHACLPCGSAPPQVC